ncbi:MAG TPA: hypothetical protein PLA84_06935 [Petrotogaceae bacterium]|nr:hypothetical protein [Petrotogaceae bacterium]
MDLKISKKIETNNKSRKFNINWNKKELTTTLRNSVKKNHEDNINPAWNYIVLFILFIGIFGILVKDLVTLQVAEGEEMLSKSLTNKVKIKTEPALRGAILDRNGVALAQNVSSMNVYILIENYLDSDGYVEAEKLQKTVDLLAEILGDNWKKNKSDGKSEYSSIMEKILSVHKESPYFQEILIAEDIDNDTAIKVKANLDRLTGVYIEDGSKRYYPEKNIISHILGYTGDVTAEDLEKKDYVDITDTIGITGIEREYDEKLLVTKNRTFL